jgi:hypothetical protein
VRSAAASREAAAQKQVGRGLQALKEAYGVD